MLLALVDPTLHGHTHPSRPLPPFMATPTGSSIADHLPSVAQMIPDQCSGFTVATPWLGQRMPRLSYIWVRTACDALSPCLRTTPWTTARGTVAAPSSASCQNSWRKNRPRSAARSQVRTALVSYSVSVHAHNGPSQWGAVGPTLPCCRRGRDSGEVMATESFNKAHWAVLFNPSPRELRGLLVVFTKISTQQIPK